MATLLQRAKAYLQAAYPKPGAGWEDVGVQAWLAMDCREVRGLKAAFAEGFEPQLAAHIRAAPVYPVPGSAAEGAEQARDRSLVGPDLDD